MMMMKMLRVSKMVVMEIEPEERPCPARAQDERWCPWWPPPARRGRAGRRSHWAAAAVSPRPAARQGGRCPFVFDVLYLFFFNFTSFFTSSKLSISTPALVITLSLRSLHHSLFQCSPDSPSLSSQPGNLISLVEKYLGNGLQLSLYLDHQPT